jgi:DNA-binding IclR family transcriptional regulator
LTPAAAGGYDRVVLQKEQHFFRENRQNPMSATAVSGRRAASVPAVDRAAGILLALGNGGRDATLTELARDLGMHKSTAHNILETLARHGFVSRDGATRRYRLGPALPALGHAAAIGPGLVALARPHLIRLQQRSGETVTLHVREGAGSVILASEESTHELRVSARPGHRLPAAAGAVAKILLAYGSQTPPRLPEQLPMFTRRTIASRARYLDELRRVRRAGVAFDEMEYLPGVRAVSAPVFSGGDGGGEAIAALSIVGVAARIAPPDLRRLARPLTNAARALSAMLRSPADHAPSARATAARSNGRRRRSR